MLYMSAEPDDRTILTKIPQIPNGGWPHSVGKGQRLASRYRMWTTVSFAGCHSPGRTTGGSPGPSRGVITKLRHPPA